MAVQVSYPGVYIEEFTPGAPIEGVGTSTAAFIGPSGGNEEPGKPAKITSWDQFRQRFGDRPIDGFYLWYAVRGFFSNGGQVCYVTRVSNATYAELTLNDARPANAQPQPTIIVRAKKLGVQPAITVVVQHVTAVPGGTGQGEARLFRPTATIRDARGTSITVTAAANAARFRPGDRLTWNGINETIDVEVFRIEDDVIRIVQPLANIYTAGTIRLFDLEIGEKVFRVVNAAKLASGSVITLRRGQGANAVVDAGLQVRRVDSERISSVLTTYRVELRTGLTKRFPMSADTPVQSAEFKLTVTQSGTSKDYNELSMDPEHPNYYARVINNDQSGVVIAEPAAPPNTAAPPQNRPAETQNPSSLTSGTAENLTALAASDYIESLKILEAIDNVNIIAIPDRTDEQVQLALIEHCETMQDRFAILDAARDAPPFGTNSVEQQIKGRPSASGYAALYYPWLVVPPQSGNDTVVVPPSGHVAGVMARIDQIEGVHKAPAGTDATIRNALGVTKLLSDIDQGQLNPIGVNVIRSFSGGRPVVWGARTTAGDLDRNWQYINVRRLFMFVEESIQENIRWAVFQPNNLQLWQKLRRTITEFLTRVWRDGALFGKTAEDAFYVRIDEALNPVSTQKLGRLYIEIGLRPTYPAEFIIVRIGIWDGGSEIVEA
jgi:phage tail sheath protein FI